MSRVINIDKHQDHHTNSSNNTSDLVAPKPSLTDEKNRSVLDTTIKEVKKEFKKLITKRRELIIRLGNAFESVYASNPESICKKIKNCLREEIADGIISARDIERYCPDKWKKKTKPKNDKLSFSKPSEQKPQQQIAVTQDGKSVTINETTCNTNASDGINQQQLITQRLDQSKQNGIDINDNNEGQTTSILHEPKANIETTTFIDFTPEDPLDCIEFTIPQEKYGMVIAAMDKSKASIFVKFDGNKNFLGADPDVVFDISGANHRDGHVQQIQRDDLAKDEENFKRHSKGHRRAVSDVGR